jgi:Sigma-70 region 2
MAQWRMLLSSYPINAGHNDTDARHSGDEIAAYGCFTKGKGPCRMAERGRHDLCRRPGGGAGARPSPWTADGRITGMADLAMSEELRSRLWGVAYRITGSAMDADDAVQEAWLR